jgi:hypothetical protein
MQLNFDKATLADALYIADRLRPSGLEECSANSTEEARTVLQHAWENSSHAWTMKTTEGTPVGICRSSPRGSYWNLVSIPYNLDLGNLT